MSKSPGAIARMEERARNRQNQILAAARTCVIDHGIHGATISRICTAASMTVGHLYKIYDSKEAIMIALTERDFTEWVTHITPNENFDYQDVEGFIARYINDIPFLLDRNRAIVAQEVLAESARNQKIADLVNNVDDQLRNIFRKILVPIMSESNRLETDGRVEALIMFTRSLSIHACTHLDIDPKVIAIGFEPAIRAILSAPGACPKEGEQASKAAPGSGVA